MVHIFKEINQFKVHVEFLNDRVKNGDLQIGCNRNVYHVFVDGKWQYSGDWQRDKYHILMNGGVIRMNKRIKIDLSA